MKNFWSLTLIFLLFSSHVFAAGLCENVFTSSNSHVSGDLHKAIIELINQSSKQNKQNAYNDAKISFIDSYIKNSASSETRVDITVAILESAQGKPEMDPAGLRKAIYAHYEKTRNHQEWSLSKESESEIYTELKSKMNLIKKNHDTYHRALADNITLLKHIADNEHFTSSDVNLMKSQISMMEKHIASVALEAKVKKDVFRNDAALKEERAHLNSFVAALDETYSNLRKRDQEDFTYIYNIAENFYMKAYTEIH